MNFGKADAAGRMACALGKNDSGMARGAKLHANGVSLWHADRYSAAIAAGLIWAKHIASNMYPGQYAAGVFDETKECRESEARRR